MAWPKRTVEVRHCGLRDVTSASQLMKASWHSAHDQILGERRATDIGRRIYSRFNLGMLVLQSLLWSRNMKMLIATIADRVTVGVAMAQLDTETSEIVLYLLYVHPERTGLGVGSALLQAVVTEYPEAKAIRLEVLKENGAAIAWYKAKGFQVYGETRNAIGTPNVAALYMDRRFS